MSVDSIQHLDLALLPAKHKLTLCKVLDKNDSWEELGILMQFTDFDVDVSQIKKQIFQIKNKPKIPEH